jgi:hypothetical protein
VNSKLATLVGLVAAASLVVGYLQWKEKDRLASENAQLRSALEPAQSADSSTPAQKIDPETTAAATAEKLELLRLRNEVRQLREGAKELEKLRAEEAALKLENSRLRTAQAGGESTTTNAPGLVAKQDWRFAGYSSPETTLQSWSYSMATGDLDGFLEALAPADRESFMKKNDMTKAKEKFAAEAKGSDNIAGYRILGRVSSTDEKVVLAIEILGVDGKSKQQAMIFIRDGQEWKMTQIGGRNRTPSQ